MKGKRGRYEGGEGEGGKVSAGADPGRRTRTSELPVRRPGEPAASERAPVAHDQLEEVGLSPEDRLQLIVNTNAALDKAYTAFGDACAVERDAVREAAKAGNAVFGLLFDIAMGFLLPGLSKGIGRVLDRLPVSSSEAAYRMVLALQSDQVGGMVSVATGNALEHAKGSALPADTSEIDAYLTHLAVTFHKAAARIGADLWARPDHVIAATWAAFHEDLTNQATYEQEIRRLIAGYRKGVQPIGTTRDGGRGSGDWRVEWTDTMMAYEVTDGAALRGVALVERRRRDDTGEESYRLVEWIPPELQDVARKKVRALTGSDLGTLPISKVTTS